MNKMQMILVAAFILVATACSTNPDIQTGFAEVNGTQLYDEVSGQGDAIVMIHGNYGDLRHWDKQIEAFSNDFSLIRYDVRGFGKSADPVEGVSYNHSEDLKALMDYLDVDKAHIVGFSMGSGIVGDFVLAYPERSLSFVPVGPWLTGFYSELAKEVFDDFRKVTALIQENDTVGAREALTNLHYLMPHKAMPEVDELMQTIISDYTFWGFGHNDPAQYLQPYAITRMGEYRLPTLVMTSEYDIKACQEMAAMMEKEFSNVKKVVIKDASHIMMLEEPETFNQAVLEFLVTSDK